MMMTTTTTTAIVNSIKNNKNSPNNNQTISNENDMSVYQQEGTTSRTYDNVVRKTKNKKRYLGWQKGIQNKGQAVLIFKGKKIANFKKRTTCRFLG